MVFLLDSDKQSFHVDNVPKFIKIKAAIVKIQCFENESDFFGTLNDNMIVCYRKHVVNYIYC